MLESLHSRGQAGYVLAQGCALMGRGPVVRPTKRVRALLTAVEKELCRQLGAIRPELGRTMVSYLAEAGGKRLRPALALLCAQVHGADPKEVFPAAAALEMVHMASLLHDDLVDRAQLRRSKPTVNALWGNDAAVLAGDVLFANGFLLLGRRAGEEAAEAVASAVSAMAQGEIRQLELAKARRGIMIGEYLRVIRAKTASYMAACCQVGGLLAGVGSEELAVLRAFGLSLGMAYQITDDILDAIGSPEVAGKDTLADLSHGCSAPLVFLEAEADALRSWLMGRREGAGAFVAALRETGAVDAAQRLAARYIDRARRRLEKMPDNRWTRELGLVADSVLARVMPDKVSGI